MKRFALSHLLPVALLFAIFVAPLATGSRTLFLRDTLLTHLSMREGLARAIRDGELPLLDPLRAGGQALVGNLNAVALYPDNLLLLVGSTLWQLNAHFWLHWLVAFAAAYWLARALGWGRPAAAMTGAAYAFGGFFISQLNLYNAVAPAALAPALAAAAIELRSGARPRRGFAGLALLWALSILGGDPVLAVIALIGALIVALGLAGMSPEPTSSPGYRPWLWMAGAVALGTALAAPQLLATNSLLAESSRGFQGFAARDMGVASPGPHALLELLLPLFFGRPDSGAFWGNAYFGGTPPLYFSLAPGALALAFAVVALRHGGRARRAPLGLALAGIAFAFSSGTAVSSLLAALPGMSVVRFQGKFALLFALGAALLAGLGAHRLGGREGVGRDADQPGPREDASRRTLRLALVSLLAFYLVIVLFLATRPAAIFTAFVSQFGNGLRTAGAVDLETKRWAGVALVSLLALGIAWLASARRWARLALPVGIALQASLQLLLLRGIVPTDEAAVYRRTPAAIAALPENSRSVHGADHHLFGAELMSAAGTDSQADPRLGAQVRRAWNSGFGFAAHAGGRTTELDSSPEGLDPFTVVAAADAVKSLSDAGRIRLLKAMGVSHLLLPRRLDGVPESSARLVRTDDAIVPPLSTYEIVDAPGAATVAGCVRRAPHMNAALARLTADDFDPRVEAVIPGSGEAGCDAPSSGEARLVRDGREAVEIELEAPQGGVLVLRRAYSPVWKVEIDGRAARAVPAQMTRLAVELAPGARRAAFRVDRTPLIAGGAIALVAALALVLTARRLPRA